MSRRGFTLVEVSISALVIAVLSVTMLALMTTTGKQIQRTDARREARYFLQELVERVEAADFLTLYQNFGVEPAPFGTMKTGLYQPRRQLDDEVIPEYNPLALTDRMKETLDRLGWETALTFRFLTKEELGIYGYAGATSSTGILHLQAGWIELRVDPEEGPARTVRKVLFCPLILGRPGLIMSQCPATNEGLKRGLLEEIP